MESKIAAFRNSLPGFCARLDIFISYPSECRPLAERVAQALRDSRHRVFFDKESLLPASGFIARILTEIRRSDIAILLLTRDALKSGRFTVTELKMVRQRWSSPVGRVLAVIIDPELKPNELPAYFSGVEVMTVAGNAPAEIVAAVQRMGKLRPLCWTILILLSLLVAIALGWATWFNPLCLFSCGEVKIVSPDYVHFRPRLRPPEDPSRPESDTSWTLSPTTISLPATYSNSYTKSVSGQIFGEEIELQIDGRKIGYQAAHITEIKGGSIADSTFDTGWLCSRGNAAPVTVKAGDVVTREIMFITTSDKEISWKQLMHYVLAPDGPASATIMLRARIKIADGTKNSEASQQVECRVDIAAARARLLKHFKPDQDPHPTVWTPSCQQN